MITFKRTQWAERYFHFIALSPALIIIIILTVYPIGNVIYLSFYRYSYIEGVKYYVGLRNFIRIFSDRFFLDSLKHTFEYAILATFSEFVIGLGLALLFSARFKGKKFFLPIIIFPWMLSTIVICAIWRSIYHYQYGVINYVLQVMGLKRVGWLINTNIVMESIVIIDIWQATPLVFLILLAGLKSIPQDIHEAAEIDGAAKLQVFQKIILPLLKPYMLLVILLRTIDTFRIFDKVYVLTGGGPGNATETISFYIYREGFEFFNLGRASAASIVMLVITAAISVIYVKHIIGGQAE